MLAITLIGLVVGAALLLARHAEAGPLPPPPTEPPVRRSQISDGIELAGSGTNLPLTERLVQAFGALDRDRRPTFTVHPSIGSTGGVRALRDGAIDVALVSRPLASDECPGCIVIPYARDAVVLAAHPSVGDRSVSLGQLVELFAGERSRWSDGQPCVVLQRERGDSGHRVMEELVPGFAAVNDDAWSTGRFRVLYSDVEMQEALLSTRGAVGLFVLGAIEAQQLPLAMIAVDGHTPSVEAVSSGRYPFAKELAFVLAREPGPRLRAFLDFVRADDGAELIAAAGYAPVRAPP